MRQCTLSGMAVAFLSVALYAQMPPIGMLDEHVPPLSAPVFAPPSSGLFLGVLPIMFGLGDVDGNGTTDLLSGSDPLLLGDGHGRFVLATGASLAGANVTSGGLFGRVIADLNNDGRADFATAEASLTIRLSSGATGLVLAQTLSSGAAGALAAGDVDLDGDLDLLVAHIPINTITGPVPQTAKLYLNNGAGFFTLSTTAVFATTGGTGAALIDFDQDGDLDAATASGGLLQVALNQGGGLFSAPSTVNGPSPVTWIRTVRANADAFPDIVAGAAGTVPAIYYGGPSGVPLVGPALTPAGNVVDVRAVDLDGDNIDELAMATTLGLEVVRFTLTGPIRQALTPMHCASLDAADMDGDGDRDVMVEARAYGAPTQSYAHGGRNLRPFFNDGVGGLRALLPPLPPRDLVYGTSIGDFDGDGDPDLIGVTRDSTTFGEVALARNDGTGGFTWTKPPCLGCPVLPLSGDAVAIDFNQDGALDYMIASYPVNGVSVLTPLINAGAAGFVAIASIRIPGTVGKIGVGDFDGDGRTDVVTAESTAVGSMFLRNVGGSFAVPVPLGITNCSDVEVVDLDGDGDLDLLFAGQTSAARINNGLGVFTPDLGFPAITTTLISSSDLDRDGRPEAYIGGSIYRRSAGGAWSYFGLIPAIAAYPNAMESFSRDFDENGIADTVTSAGTLYWVLGNGLLNTATLPTSASSLPPLPCDFDRDGSTDVLAAGSTLLANRFRRLTKVGDFRPGRPYQVRLRGMPNGNAMLFASLPAPAAPIAIPPYGSLFVDPTAVVYLGFATLDPTGVADVVGWLPPTTVTMVGTPFVLQGIVDTPLGPRLTNGRRAMIENY